MINRNDIVDAITKCVGYDPVKAPKQAGIVTDAWTQHFVTASNAGLTRQELLRAIDDYYRTPGQPWPQPAAIPTIARGIRHDTETRQELPPLSGMPGIRRDKWGYVDKSAPDAPEYPADWTPQQRVSAYWERLEAQRASGRRYD